MSYFHYEDLKIFLTVKEVANILGISTHTVYKLIRDEKIKVLRPSERTTVISSDELIRYIDHISKS